MVEMIWIEPMNPLLAGQVLSQLSYTPIMAPPAGLEPAIPFGIQINSLAFYQLNYRGIKAVFLCRTPQSVFV